MTIALTTGCPDSGWDMALPVLHGAGLELLREDCKHWHDQIFQEIDITERHPNDDPLIPDPDLVDRIATRLAERASDNLLLADSRSLWLLDFWADRFPDMVFILFFTSPHTALSHALQKGLNPLQFLQTWQQGNSQLIHFQNHHRRQALLLNAELAAQNPQALIEKVQHLDLALKPINQRPSVQPHDDLRPLDHLLIANLAADKPLQELFIDLEARAHPLGDKNPLLKHTSEQLYQYYLEQLAAEQAIQTRLQEVTTVQEEQNKLAQQQAEQIERLVRQCDEKTKQADDRQSQLDSLTEELRNKQELESLKKEIEEENELLLLQLHQVQEELETYFLKYQEIEQQKEEELNTRDRKYQALQDQLQRELNDRENHYQNTVQQLKSDLDRRIHQYNELSEIRQQELRDHEYNYQQLLQQAERDLEAKESIIRAHAQCNTLLKNNLCWKIAAPMRRLSLYFKRLKKPKTLRDEISRLLKSGLFDQEWYLTHNPDVAIAGFDPVEHYLRYGAAEGRDPSNLFNTLYYLNQNPDVADSGINPLLHYIEHGIEEGRQALDN